MSGKHSEPLCRTLLFRSSGLPNLNRDVLRNVPDAARAKVCNQVKLNTSDGRNPKRYDYFIFFPPIASAGLPSRELAVAETFGFSCLGFLASLLPRLLLLPLAMIGPFKCSDPVPGWQGHHCAVHRAPDLRRRAVNASDVRLWSRLFRSLVQRLLLAAGYGGNRAAKHSICSGKVFGCVNLGPV